MGFAAHDPSGLPPDNGERRLAALRLRRTRLPAVAGLRVVNGSAGTLCSGTMRNSDSTGGDAYATGDASTPIPHHSIAVVCSETAGVLHWRQRMQTKIVHRPGVPA
jgi:hypothetical protein